MENIMLLILGVFISVMGIVNIKGNISFIVSFWSEEIMGFIILPAVIVGLGFMLYGQIKYNKGIF